MRAEKIRELDDAELAAQEREIREQLFRLRFQISMGHMDGLKKYRALKKDLARVLTIVRERQLAASPAQAGRRK
jgi:large subunit ribosomal protein L29